MRRPASEILPPAIDGLVLSRQVIERTWLDGVNEFPRFAARGDEVEPPSRQLRHHLRHALRQNVLAAEIVQEPAVATGFADRRLHRTQVEHDYALTYPFRSRLT